MTTPKTELEEAIRQTELYKSKSYGGWVIPQSTVDTLLLAAKRIPELEQRLKGALCVLGEVANVRDGLRIRVRELEKERDVEAKAYKGAIEILKEKYEELSALRIAYKEAVEALRKLRQPTDSCEFSPKSSSWVCKECRAEYSGNIDKIPHYDSCMWASRNKVLSNPLAIEVGKGSNE